MNRLAAGVAVEDKLGESIAVAQVDEDQSAVIAIGVNPSSQRTSAPTSEREAGRRCGNDIWF